MKQSFLGCIKILRKSNLKAIVSKAVKSWLFVVVDFAALLWLIFVEMESFFLKMGQEFPFWHT